MRAAFTWIVFLIITCSPLQLWGQDNGGWIWKTSPIELEESGSTPRIGMAVGHHNGMDILAGGMEVDSLGEGWYYDDIYVRSSNSKKWVKQKAKLPFSKTAHTLTTDKGLICIGAKSLSENNDLYQGVLLSWNAETKNIDLKPLKGFSKEMIEKVVLYSSNILYFLDVNMSSNSITKLQIQTYNLESNKSGQIIHQLPEDIKGSSVGSIQGNGLHNCLYFFQDSENGNSTYTNTFNLFSNSWSKNPIKNQKIKNLDYAASCPIGAAHNLILGAGENRNELFSHYTITDAWNVLDTLPAIPYQQELFSFNQNTIRLPATNDQNQLVLLEGSIPSQQQTFGTLNYIVLGLYFLVLILMGVYFSRRQKSTEDYFKGGGRIPWWAAGISIFGTALSAISFMAIPAKTFATDWAYLFNNLGPLYVAPIIALFFVPFFIRLDLNTAYEYLEKRFNLATRLLGSLSFIIYQIGRIGIVLYLPAIALNVVTGLDILFCIALMGILSVIYTMMGGIEGVIWTDVLQVIILMGGGFLCLVILIMSTEGGLSTWWQTAVADNKFNIWDMRIDWQHPTLIVVLLGGFFSNLVSYSTDQTFVQRYLTATDVGKAQKSVYTNALLMLPATLLFFALGTALYIFYQQFPSELQTGLSATDAIFPYFILSQLPQGVSGLLIAGVFAAAMSTLSSSMNSVASAYSNDFHARFGWLGSPMKVARWSTLVTGLVGTLFAMLMATSDIKSVWDEFLKIIGLITGGLGGIFVLGMASKSANGKGALIGLLGSAVIQYWLGVTKPIHLLLFTATGFISALGIGWLASLLFKEKNKDEV